MTTVRATRWKWRETFLLLAALTLPAAASDRALSLFEAGDLRGARHAFQTILDRSPDDPVAHYYLGRLTPQDGPARKHFEQVLAENPRHALADDALLELAESYYASPMGLFKTARTLFVQLLTDYPRSRHRPHTLYRIGRTFLITHQPDSAASYFERARRVADRPGRTFSRHGLAEADRQAGAHGLARARLDSIGEGTLYPFGGKASPSATRGRAVSSRAQSKVGPAGTYWVQVGAFSYAEGAAETQRSLEVTGLNVVTSKNHKGLTVLKAGPFGTREEAARIVRHLRRVDRIDAIVIQE